MELLTVSAQVLGRSDKQVRIISEQAQCRIVGRAKQSAHLSGLMVMIDAEAPTPGAGLAADGATPGLGRFHGSKLLKINAIFGSQMLVESLLRIAATISLSIPGREEFRVIRTALALPFANPLTVPLVIFSVVNPLTRAAV